MALEMIANSAVHSSTRTYFYNVITVRNEVGKVMFLHLSVCPQGVGGWGLIWGSVCSGGCLVQGRLSARGGAWSRGGCLVGGGVPGPVVPLRQTPRTRHPPADGYCCGRNASYWNAFLFCS